MNTNDLTRVLRPYGFLAPALSDCPVRFGNDPAAFDGLPIHTRAEPGGALYYPARRQLFRAPGPIYHALLPHITFEGAHIAPVWVNKAGRALIAWLHLPGGGAPILLVGLDVVEEIVRYRQGDPAQVERTQDKARFGFDYIERPNYLFDAHILPDHATQPWADHLGYHLAEALARLMGHPLAAPLPGGARGALAFTGDDDMAYLEKYDEQLRATDDLPITYFLHPQTRHSSATLAALPARVVLGLHPDALDRPDAYDAICAAQSTQINRLAGRALRLVRNHGYLNRGYLGHLSAWERCGLTLDVNIPGVDGTALNGSFLPMRTRRPDGSWSDHYSLLTLFGDGMIYALAMTPRQASGRIRRLARQIERARPGVMVLNFHPQNVGDAYPLHRAAVRVARRRGWVALDLERYLAWIETLAGLRLEDAGGALHLGAPGRVVGLVLRWPVRGGWRRQALDAWEGARRLVRP